MADTKISALPASTTPLAGTEVLPIVQSGTTKKVAVSDLTAGRTVSGLNFISGSDTATFNIVAGASTTGPGVQAYGKSAGAAPGWVVYTSGVTDFVGTHAWYKNNFAGAATYLGGWYANGDYKIATGNLIQGTAAKGVDFSANTGAAGKTSTLLNWYEEGTFTPTLSFGGGSTGIAYQTWVYGTYTRIGNLVYVRGAVGVTNKGSSTGQARMGGLPFAANSTPPAYVASWSDISYTGSLTAYISGTDVIFQQVSEAGVNSAITDGNFTNNSEFRFGFVYPV